MKEGLQLALKLAIIICFTFLPCVAFLLRVVPDNDSFYWKVTKPATHFIAGDSRAFRGISPEVLTSELDLQGHMQNLAFTGVHSPYGKYYTRFLKRKIRKGNTPSLFILATSPISLMDFEGVQVPRESEFRAFNLFFVNMNPNIEYLLRYGNMKQSLLDILLDGVDGRSEKSRTYKDGWGVRLDPPRVLAPDKILPAFKKRSRRNKLVESPGRQALFEKLVQQLQEEGDVVILRLPLPKQVWEYEQEFAPFLEPFLLGVTQKTNAKYFNYAPLGDAYVYHDGLHHLDSISAVKFSKHLAHRIQTEIYNSGE